MFSSFQNTNIHKDNKEALLHMAINQAELLDKTWKIMKIIQYLGLSQIIKNFAVYFYYQI